MGEDVGIMKTLALGALLVAVAFPAFATTVVALDVPAMSRAADSIVQGRVVRVEPKLSKDGRRITTHVTVEVLESLKAGGAAATGTVEIVQPGGVVGDIGQKVHGTAHLQVGDEVVTFLERRGAKAYQLVGMAQGCFRVERSSDGAAAFAVQAPEDDLFLLDPVTRAPVAKDTSPMKLDELKGKIRAALAPPGVAEEPRTPGPILRESVK